MPMSAADLSLGVKLLLTVLCVGWLLWLGEAEGGSIGGRIVGMALVGLSLWFVWFT
jgi:hypothetical protein